MAGLARARARPPAQACLRAAARPQGADSESTEAGNLFKRRAFAVRRQPLEYQPCHTQADEG